MRMFPLFMDIEKKRIMLVGSGRLLFDRLEKILPYGAKIDVYTEDVFFAREGITVHCGMPGRQDFIPPPVLMLIAGIGETETERLCRQCGEIGIPVNVADEPQKCDFYFPALITKGGMTIAVSTSGKSPTAAKILREQIERQLPSKIDEILDWAEALRCEIRKKEYDCFKRKEILKKAVAYAIEQNRTLATDEIEEVIRSIDE